MTQPELNELGIAELNERLASLGLDPGFGRAVQARMVRVSHKIEALQKLVNEEQFALLTGMIRRYRGDIEPVVDGLIDRAQSGLLFEIKESPKAEIQSFTNRKMRRKKQR